MHLRDFAPVSNFEMVGDAISHGRISGLASPASGSKPCALALVAGSATVACTTAVEFSSEAQSRGVRKGWCAFAIGGAGQAAALAEQVEVRCLVSNQILAQWESTVLAAQLVPPKQTFLTVQAMLHRVSIGIVTDIDQIMPFALALAQTRGPATFKLAMFLYMLGRSMGSADRLEVAGDVSTPDGIRECWTKISNSDEFLNRKLRGLPGPFQPGFAFPLYVLDE